MFIIMDTTNNNETFTQGAEAITDCQLHENIMQELAQIEGSLHGHVQDNRIVYNYYVKALTEERALFIAKRGNFDEILSMIHNYGKTIYHSKSGLNHAVVETAILPESVQVIIANSNNQELIRAYLSYWGFDKLAQDVIINRGNHEELMYYIERHGFQAKQQRALLARGNEEEIKLHIQKHGLAEEILDEMFIRIASSDENAINDFHRFINLHELSTEFQKRMTAVVASKEFEAYVKRYGLWNETHKELVNNRSIQDVNYYLSIHKYLYYDAEAMYLKKAGRQDRFRYVENKPAALGLTFDNLIREEALDYELLNILFTIYHYDTDGKDKAKQIPNMSHSEVMLYIQTEYYFPMRVVSAIFYRNNKEEFEALVKRMLRK